MRPSALRQRFLEAALTAALLCVAESASNAQPLAQGGYPNVDKQLEVAPGDTVQLLSRLLLEGGPAMRPPGKRLEFYYTTRIPASDTVGRASQADRAAQRFGADAVDVGVRRLSIGICDTRACAQRRDPPATWFMYERTASGWRRVRS